MIFSLQKQTSGGYRLICAYCCPQYNLAGKSNTTCSSKINCFDGIINRQLTHYIPSTKQSMRETFQSQGQIKHKSPCNKMNACRRIQIPSLIFRAYLQSFLSHRHPAKLLQLLMMGRYTFFLTVRENGIRLDSLTCPTHSLQGNVS